MGSIIEKRYYSPQEKKFISDFFDKIKDKYHRQEAIDKVTEAVNKKFNTNRSRNAIEVLLIRMGKNLGELGGKHFSQEEISFIKDKLDKRIHPCQFLTEFHEKFKNKRPLSSIYTLARRLGYNLKMIPKIITKEVREDSLLNYYKKQYEMLLKESILQDKVIAICQESIKSLPPIKNTHYPVFKPSTKKTKEEALLLFSDAHIGEEINLEETGGLNSYDFDIFVKRYQFYIDTVIDLVKDKLKGYDIKKLNIAMLGDNVSGIIHEELKETSRLDIVSQVFNGAYVVAQGIRDLAQNFEEIDIFGVPGTHGRMTEKKRYKQRYVSWDYVFYCILTLLLKDIHNIKTYFPKCFFLQKVINNHNFLFLHGDDIQMWMNVPWYGIDRMVARFNEVLEQRIENVIMGHFHNSASLQKISGEKILNGSFSGANEFSLGKLFTGNKPVQKIMGVHKKYGISWSYSIKLEDASVSSVRYKYSIPFEKPLIAGEIL